jgi:hypothetical protein
MTEDLQDAHPSSHWNRLIAAELATIGIEAEKRSHASGFLDGIRIEKGRLLYSSDAPPSNLLHEAGHLAIMPTAFRHLAEDRLSQVFAAMGEALQRRMDETGNPDDPLIRAIMQCSDMEATAWAWAFGVRVGLPHDIIILDSEYGGDGAGVRMQVSHGMYLGINGLRAAGMVQSVRTYPQLSKWLQDAS